MHSRIPFPFFFKMMRTPDVMARISAALIRRRLFLTFPQMERGPLAVRQISIKITNACNLRCKMCAQWGERGYNFGRPTSVIRETVPIEVYRRMVDEVAPLKPFVYIWGGEPFLYPDLMELVYDMEQRDMVVAVVTNGTRMGPHVDRMVEDGWDCLMVSLDGPREVHDEIRGQQGCFDTLAEHLQALREARERRGCVKPYVLVLSTISQDNAAILDRNFEAAEVLGVDGLIMYYSWFTTEEIGERHTEIVQKRLGCTPTAWRGYLLPFEGIDVTGLQRAVRRIQDRKWTFPYVFLPELEIHQIPEYYRYPGRFFGYSKCVSPWMVTELMPNGDVATCRDYPDFVTGNIKDAPLLEIFNNERYQAFRGALREEGFFPICARCCGLMGF